MIESVLSWLTPTVLFCVLNLMIATILITSTFRNNDKKQQQEGEDQQLPPTPSLLQRVRSVNLSFPDPFNSPLTTHHHLPDNNMSPSLLQRVRSINFSFSSQNPTPFPSLDEQPAAAEEVDLKCHVTRSKSSTCAEEEEEEEVVVRKEKKMGNRRRGGKKLFGNNEEEDAVDKKADDFINKFKEQLKMQRIHSILNYKEMLNRGVSL